MRQTMVMVGAMLAMAALAMPTKQDLVDVQPLVQELMRKDIAAMNAGTKTATQVADVSVALVPSAETEAAKFVLLRAAVTLYARGGQYDKAADAMDMLLATVKDMPPETVE